MTADFVNHRSVHEPLEARLRGPQALQATAIWLRRAFSDIRFVVDEIAVIGDRAVAWVTMHAVNTGPFVVYDSPDGTVTEVFPPTGRSFSTRQVHWFRIADGAIAEHDAVRDDLGMAKAAGWIPPRPAYILRMRSARRRERRRATAGTPRAEQPPVESAHEGDCARRLVGHVARPERVVAAYGTAFGMRVLVWFSAPSRAASVRDGYEAAAGAQQWLPASPDRPAIFDARKHHIQ